MDKQVLRTMLMDLADLYNQEKQMTDLLQGFEVDRLRGVRARLEGVKARTVVLGRDVMRELNLLLEEGSYALCSDLPKVPKAEVDDRSSSPSP